MLTKGTIRGTVEIDGTDPSVKKLRSVEKAFDDLGSKGLNLGERLRQAGPGIAVGIAAIGASVMAIRATADALARVGREVHALGMLGGELSPITTAFERLSSPELLARLHEQTGYLVSERTLLAESVQALRARMLSEDEWVESLGAITRLSQDAGENVDMMVSAFANIAAGGGVESLARLGVNVSELREQLRLANVSGESLEGRTMLLRGAMEQMARATGGASNEATNYADAVTRLRNRFEIYRIEVSRTFAENSELVQSFQEIEDLLVDLSPNAETLGDAIADLALDATDAALAFAEWVEPIMNVVDALGQLNDAINTITQAGNVPGLIAEWAAFLGLTEPGGGRVGETRQRISDIRAGRPTGRRDLWTGESTMPEADPWATPGAPQSVAETTVSRRRRGGGGGGGATPSGISMDAMLTAMSEQAALAQQIAAYRERESEALAELKDRTEEVARAEEVRIRTAQSAIEVEQRAMEMRQEAEERFLAMRQLELEIAQHIAEKDEQIAAANIAKIESSADVANSLAGIFGMLADAEAEGSENADSWRKAQGVALGIYETIMAVSEVAKAIGAAPDPFGIAVHAASAAMHGVAAGLAFTQLAQTGGGGASSASAATSKAAAFRPAASRPHATGGMSEAGNTINVYSWGRSQADAGRVIAEQDWQRVHKGAPVRVPRGIGFAA